MKKTIEVLPIKEVNAIKAFLKEQVKLHEGAARADPDNEAWHTGSAKAYKASIKRINDALGIITI
jgi:hypothetical protein